jgi:hypothetical protein
MTRINDLMPTYRLRQVERLPVAASVADAWAAARGLDIYDISHFRSLIWLRVLPERTLAWLRGRPEPLSREPGTALVLGSPEIRPEYRQNAHLPAYVMSWAFVLAPIGDDATELQVRVRAAYDAGLKMAATRTIVGAAHEIMERVQLRNLKRRVEGASSAPVHKL